MEHEGERAGEEGGGGVGDWEGWGQIDVSAPFDNIRSLAAAGDLTVSDHASDRMAQRGVAVADVFAGVAAGVVIEDYPDYFARPSVLVLPWDRNGLPIHVLWGPKKGTTRPATVVTAYRPDPNDWTDDFRRRR